MMPRRTPESSGENPNLRAVGQDDAESSDELHSINYLCCESKVSKMFEDPPERERQEAKDSFRFFRGLGLRRA
jgi:hypothetical protein